LTEVASEGREEQPSMTVYVMGAGASLHAKYPLGRDLLRKLAEWLNKGIDQSKTLIPTEIARIREDYEQPLSRIQEKFPTLDNCEEILRKLDWLAKEGGPEANSSRLPNLRDKLASAVREFFFDIGDQEAVGAYDLFARMHAKSGDFIITFNYDVALERALKGAGKWDIKLGYGLPFPFFPDARSDVTVLKLHGSVNWFQHPQQQYLPPLIAGRDLFRLGYQNLTDPRIPEHGFSTNNTGTLILPDPNKQYHWDNLWRTLWHQAETKLACTQHLVIHGYSLPKSDCEPRKLLLTKTNHDASIEICCISDSNGVASDFRNHGFSNVTPRSETTFEKWAAENAKG
jgi:hypothetical protein